MSARNGQKDTLTEHIKKRRGKNKVEESDDGTESHIKAMYEQQASVTRLHFHE